MENRLPAHFLAVCGTCRCNEILQMKLITVAWGSGRHRLLIRDLDCEKQEASPRQKPLTAPANGAIIALSTMRGESDENISEKLHICCSSQQISATV